MGGRPRRAASGPLQLILIDTSAWIEFLRDTNSPACRSVDTLLGAEFATCEPVVMEVLAGARNERHLDELRRLLARGSAISTTPTDYEEAAALSRVCRRSGETLRRLIDCLIAAVAIRAAVEILHADADYDALARHTALLAHRR